MSDVFTKAKRSEVMSRIRGRGNKDTELALAKLLRRHRITGWRRQVEIQIVAAVCDRRSSKSTADGAHRAPLQPLQPLQRTTQRAAPPFRVRPDFIFSKLKLAVFVDGCFWHGCPKHATKPKNNAAFWRRKFATNQKRDVLVTQTLRKAGWRVVRIWECALQRATKSEVATRRLLRPIQQASDANCTN